MTKVEVIMLVKELIKTCPWLKECLRIMDITDIGDMHELTNIITNF